MKKRSFFRRKSIAADPNGKEPKPSRRNFGRVATMQPVRPEHEYDEDDYAPPPMRRAASEDNLSNVRQLDPDLHDDEPPLVNDYVKEEHLDAGEHVHEEDEQPKIERGRSSKSQRHLKKRGSGKRAKDRDRERERDHKEHKHDRLHRQREDDAALLIELNKLLDTLTSRELQLSLRVDKADEAVREALARRGSGDVEAARKRALGALKHKRLLERSLAVTTAQSDRVLRMLGHNVLTPLGERIEAAALRQRNNIPDDFIGDLGVLDACDDEQILREIDATIGAPRLGDGLTGTGAYAGAADGGVGSLDPAESTDWLAEVRQQYAQRSGTSDRESQKPSLPQRRDKAVDHQHQVHEFETVPEPDPLLKPRLSRDSRAVSIEREVSKASSPKLSRSGTFSRRRKKDKERM